MELKKRNGVKKEKWRKESGNKIYPFNVDFSYLLFSTFFVEIKILNNNVLRFS